MPSVLVVDDEQAIVELARVYLEQNGFTVRVARDGRAALEEAQSNPPALIVLDLMLPELDGYEVCRRLRQTSQVPILMLTARSEDSDKIVGLELGADDYLTKPFNPRELVARVKAILRRAEVDGRQSHAVEAGGVRLDFDRREVVVAGAIVPMRAKEFDLLATFMKYEGIVLTRERLLDLVWGYDFYGESRTVDVHVKHVREKLEGSALSIETLRGVGYKLVARA